MNEQRRRSLLTRLIQIQIVAMRKKWISQKKKYKYNYIVRFWLGYINERNSNDSECNEDTIDEILQEFNETNGTNLMVDKNYFLFARQYQYDVFALFE